MAMITKEQARRGVWGREGVGAFVTAGLFLDSTKSEEIQKKALFQFGPEDREGYHNFHTLYMDLTVDDPSEYSLAIAVFGTWDHWEAILNNPTLLRQIEKLRKERDIKIKSIAMQKIFDKAKSGDYQANKYVAEKGYNSEVLAPERKKTAKQAKEESLARDNAMRLQKETSEDMERLGLINPMVN